MAVGSATPHRARVRRESAQGRVEGRVTTRPAFSKSFRCRFTPASESEQRDQSGVRRQRSPTLFFSRLAIRSSGAAPLRASDRVEVTHDGVVTLYEVQGDPKPVQKRRSVIAYVAQIQKVRDTDA